jgi:2,4-diketo-3-deoxy-L-fuconate hydrolase
MRFVSFVVEANGSGPRPRAGALLNDAHVVDLVEAFRSLGRPAPASDEEPLGWLDLDEGWLPAACALLGELAAEPATFKRLDHRGAVLDVAQVRLVAPVPRPRKVLCIGLNYRDHAKETGKALPERPLLFSKLPTCVIGPNDSIVIPRITDQVDYEAELGVVIGRTGKHVRSEDALNHVAGYVNFNDVSARDMQFGDGQWQRGKSCDTFAPMGPWMVTADEICDPGDLRVRLRLNGETMQDSRTRELIFGVPELVRFLSQTITLEPGDVIATGTPPGVGAARKPPVFLKPGDRVEVEVEGLGVLSNPVEGES